MSFGIELYLCRYHTIVVDKSERFPSALQFDKIAHQLLRKQAGSTMQKNNGRELKCKVTRVEVRLRLFFNVIIDVRLPKELYICTF